jgi:hypothetical protein
MASRSTLHAALSEPREGRPMAAMSFLWAGFLTALIAGPWLLPGYLFGTDWPGPRRFDFPTAISSYAPLDAILASISWIVGGEVTGKLFVIAVLFTSAALAYWTGLGGGFVPRATGATIYLMNPFVYGRLHYGQIVLLGAYAVFPLAGSRFRSFLLEPRVMTALWAAAAFALVGMLSPHVLLLTGVLAGSALLTQVVTAKGRLDYLKRVSLLLLLVFGATTALSAYWLIPLALGNGLDATAIARTGAGDLNAYAAVPDRSLGLLPNLVGLYGFWAENTGRFTSMKDFVPMWPIVLVLVLAIAGVGAVRGLRHPITNQRAWVGGLVLATGVALFLEAGVSSSFTADVVKWIDAHFSIYRGMRDAGKWTVLLAFVYAQLVGLGAAAIQVSIRKPLLDRLNADWALGTAAALLLALPLYYGNGLLFGMHGEIRPSEYPAGWYAADRTLTSDPNPERTLFLPWHEYMSYSFIRNQNRVVAPPALKFFSVQVIASTDPEVPGVQAPHSSDQDAVAGLVRDGQNGRWAQVLSSHHIKYVLLAKELDWAFFNFLDDQPGLSKVGDFGSIVLYRNDLVS